MKPKLKPPGTERLKLNYYILLSASAFKINLRRYIGVFVTGGAYVLARRFDWQIKERLKEA